MVCLYLMFECQYSLEERKTIAQLNLQLNRDLHPLLQQQQYYLQSNLQYGIILNGLHQGFINCLCLPLLAVQAYVLCMH